MCLMPEWFEQRAARKKHRDEFGVSVRDAKECLKCYDTTIDPIATEMAEWILNNWNDRQIANLGAENSELFHRIVREVRLQKLPDAVK